MLPTMTNDDAVTTTREQKQGQRERREAARADRHRKREREFEHLLGKLAEAIIGAGMLLYKSIEDVKGRVEMSDAAIEALQETLDEINVEESEIAAGVQTAGERFTELLTLLNGLPTEGGSITKEEVEALNTKAQATLGGLTTAASALTEETPADPNAPKEEETSGETNKPTKSVYVFTGDAEPDLTEWTPSGFETTDTPPVALFYFNGDSGPGETNGQGIGAWALYTGSTKAVPASA